MASLKILTLSALVALAMAQHRQVVSSPFNATAYNELLDCVNNASSRYEIAINDGTIVIIPPQGETIDLDSEADGALGDCLDEYTSYLDLAVDQDRSCVDDDGAVAASQDLATAAWAGYNGAQGITLQHGTHLYARSLGLLDPESVALSPRQEAAVHYVSLGSFPETDCSNYDHEINVFDECINHDDAYRSIIFSNADQYNSIRVERWPHHKCARDYDPPGKDGRTISIPADTDSACLNRSPKRVFSFRGKLVAKKCFGTCA